MKHLPLLVLAALAVGLLAGCSSGTTNEAPAPGSTPKSADAPPARGEK